MDADGHNLWHSLAKNLPSPRREVLLNIDDNRKIAALRVNEWKLIKGRL